MEEIAVETLRCAQGDKQACELWAELAIKPKEGTHKGHRFQHIHPGEPQGLTSMQMEWKARACHSERQRRMTVVADSSFFARCANGAIYWNQYHKGMTLLYTNALVKL